MRDIIIILVIIIIIIAIYLVAEFFGFIDLIPGIGQPRPEGAPGLLDKLFSRLL